MVCGAEMLRVSTTVMRRSGYLASSSSRAAYTLLIVPDSWLENATNRMSFPSLKQGSKYSIYAAVGSREVTGAAPARMLSKYSFCLPLRPRSSKYSFPSRM